MTVPLPFGLGNKVRSYLQKEGREGDGRGGEDRRGEGKGGERRGGEKSVMM